MPKTHNKNEFSNGFTGKSNGLHWYFNGNHWNFCDGFYWASIVFFSREVSRLIFFFKTGYNFLKPVIKKENGLI